MRRKSHRDFGYCKVSEKTQTEGMTSVAKTTVNFDSEIIDSLLLGDLTYIQSMAKVFIGHPLEREDEKCGTPHSLDHGVTKIR